MCFISVAEAAGLHHDSDYLHYVPRLRPPVAAVSADSLLAYICRLMSPLMAITTHNVITPLNSLLPSALWLLVPGAHQPSAKKHSQLACFHCRAKQGHRRLSRASLVSCSRFTADFTTQHVIMVTIMLSSVCTITR